MEENNYRDDFEHFLKETTDEFRMVPYRKVWYSIYNGMHPDRRWPSITVCLLILISILFIGISNNNSLSNAARKANQENFKTSLGTKNINKTIPLAANTLGVISKNKITVESLLHTNLENPIYNNVNTIASNSTATPSATSKPYDIENTNFNKEILENNNTKNLFSTNKKINIAIINSTAVDEDMGVEKEKFVVANNEADSFSLAEKNKQLADDLLKEDLQNNKLKTSLLLIEKAWKEDYAFRNKPAINKFKQNAGITYYITPSIGYRGFYKTNQSKYSGSLLIVNGNNDKFINDIAALNLEAGFSLHYNISKHIRLKTGLQSNYTNFISNVTELAHPTQTSLAVNSLGNNQRSSSYSSSPGKTKLNRTTLQIALPIGADFKISGNDKFKWYIGTTLQPTYIISGSSYVLSADERHYIAENPLLRKLNLNTSLETFVTFKASSGVLISVGPQFRYQLLSTYKSNYNYAEKLYNVGVKVGLSTSF